MPARDPLSPDAVASALSGLSGWRHEDDALVRELEFADFREAFAFLTRVAFEAEALDHHPEIRNVYNSVRLAVTTHDAGNRVTETDLAFARRVNALQR